MWRQLLAILADIPKPGEDTQPLRKLWPMLILVVLYTLSGWIKNKQSKKSPPPSRPTPTPPRQQTRSLPSYARKRVPKPVQQQPSRPPTPQPSKPIPTIQRPAPTARRPAGPQVTRQPRMAPPPGRPAVQKRPVTRPPKHAAAVALAGQLTKDQIAAKRQMMATREAAQLRRTSREEEKTAVAAQAPAIESLQQVLSNRNTAAQAIVMAEILGQPLGLRTSGSYECKSVRV